MGEKRSRAGYSVAAGAVMALGLETRPFKRVNDVAGSALGDALWAALVYLVIVTVFPRVRPLRAWVAATGVAWVVEVSQLWHVGWLDAVRHTTLGALAVGGSFSFGDLWCYLAGTTTVFLIEQRRGIGKNAPPLR